MKHASKYFVLAFFLVCCQSKDSIKIKQLHSQQMVTILPNDKRDSIPLCLPVEFEITLNTSEVEYIGWYYIVDNKKRPLDDFVDYHLFTSEDQIKPIHSNLILKNNPFFKTPFNVILKERNHFISKRLAEELLKKYNVKKTLNNLKHNDTIKLVGLDKFKKENVKVLNDFNKINDSIHFKILKSDGSFLYIDKKINW